MTWDQPFSKPIALPGGNPLRTLKDAGLYIEQLPIADLSKPTWQTALYVILQAADYGGPVEFARLGMMQALQPREPVYDTSRKDPKWRNTRKLASER